MRRGASVYLVTRTHGLRTHLITPRDMQILAKAKTLRDVYDNLLKTDYAVEIGQLPTQEQDATTLENIILKKLVERFFFVRRSAQGKMQDLLTRYSARFEVENIKRIIRAKHGGQNAEELNLIPLQREYTLVNFPALLKAKDVDEVASLLRDSQYRPILAKLQAYEESGTTMILEAALDKIYFSRVWELAGKMQGARNLIGEEIDLRNLLTVFSLKTRDVSAKLIEESTIPVSYALPKTTLRALLQSQLQEAPNLLRTDYSKLASEAANLLKKGSSLLLERVFFKQLYGDASAVLTTHPLQVGYIIAYLLLCECEAKNLISIVTGRQLNLGEEVIPKDLFGVQD
ncbi:MAG: V-type ATPase subunit [Candidatus Bathyarchaeia archaeon]